VHHKKVPLCGAATNWHGRYARAWELSCGAPARAARILPHVAALAAQVDARSGGDGAKKEERGWTMNEDVAGTLRTIGHDTLLCSLCGASYPADHLMPVEADPTDGVRSERADICPACRQALAQGDDPAFPLDTEGDSTAEG